MNRDTATLADAKASGPKSSLIFEPTSVHISPLQNILRVLARRRKWILGAVLACALLAALMILIVKPLYNATATIELNKGSAGSLDLGLGDVMSQQFTQGIDNVVLDLQTETTILESDSLALDVIEKLNLASQPPFALSPRELRDLPNNGRQVTIEDSPAIRTHLLRIFRKGLIVTPVHGTRLIQVTYQSRDAHQAAQIANALIESYKNQYLQSHYDATNEASQWLTQQLSGLKANVEDSEKKLSDFEKESGILSLDMAISNGSVSDSGNSVHSVVFQKLDTVNGELTRAEEERIEKEAIYHIVLSGNQDVILGLQNDPLATASKSAVLTQGNGLSVLQQLRTQRSQEEITLADASANYGPNNRHVKEVTDRIRALDGQIRSELQDITRRAQADYQLAQQTEAQLRSQFDRQQQEAGKINEKAVQLSVLSQEALSRKKLYEDLYTKLQEANVSAGIKATNITVVDPARPQSVPIQPKPTSYMEIGLLSGLFLGSILALLADHIDNTVVNPLEIEDISRLPVLGVVPKFVVHHKTRHPQRVGRDEIVPNSATSRASHSLWIVNHPNSMGAEAVRALRTGVLLARANGGPQALLITSCGPGEGKSTLSVNLAIAFAQHGKRVILVEADMRRPTLGSVSEKSSTTISGLSNLLAGSTSIDDAVIRGLHAPNFDILPSGPRPPPTGRTSRVNGF